ncbi:hypothetical protein SynSYN20_01607 [Synechococcus sp. SYN20]|uniref:hypothetical protein n=1 Tax=Synechococcus sp. SYN20 TaxID=1050714 RepID=UPI001647AF68|nr:hypothetical protein [Synechococcus sp. SYN20]QNJ25934.1 hypothetical protein SynSYN20_01607 [Synechococcus sp. SYN20]
MATRSAIGYKLPNGNIRASYCHWDGNPEHQLPILTEHYTTAEAVVALVAHGSMSQLRTRSTWDNGSVLRDAQGGFVRDAEGLLRYETEQEPGPLYHCERGDGMEPITSNYPANCWDELMDIEHLYVFHPEHSYWEHVEQD